MTPARCLVRPMLESDLETVLGWRNAPAVRRFMWTQHEISAAEHRAWFDNADREAGRHLLIFESDGISSGFIQFSAPDPGGIADWGFYRAPSAPSGSGRAMGETSLEFAFGVLGLHKICGQAIVENEASRKFHLTQGFTQEGLLRDQYFDGTKFHDVAVFGLLKRDWTARKAIVHE